MTNANSLLHEDFRLAYGSVLWTMMMLRWCDARWDRPRERAQAEARFAAIEAQAIESGLKAAMELAASDNARQMATMRLNTMCNGGFEPARQVADQALTELEGFMMRRLTDSKAAASEAEGPPQDVRIAYLMVEARFFVLRECREEGILKQVASQRERFQHFEQQLSARLGKSALTSLRDHARMQSAMKLAQPCAGEHGIERLAESLDRLAALAAPRSAAG